MPLVKTAVLVALTTLAVALLVAVPALAARPRNTMQPNLFGTPIVGETLTCTPGGWSEVPNKPTFTYEWLRNGDPIPGATSTTYVLQPADAIVNEDTGKDPDVGCRVTATNADGSASAVSPTTKVVLVLGGPKDPTPDPIKLSQVVTMPSAKKCIRFRRLSLTTKRPSGAEILGITFFINNKQKRKLDSGKVGTRVSLQDLPKKPTLKIQVDIKNANPVVGTRKYKTCKKD